MPAERDLFNHESRSTAWIFNFVGSLGSFRVSLETIEFSFNRDQITNRNIRSTNGLEKFTSTNANDRRGNEKLRWTTREPVKFSELFMMNFGFIMKPEFHRRNGECLWKFISSTLKTDNPRKILFHILKKFPCINIRMRERGESLLASVISSDRARSICCYAENSSITIWS